MDSPESNKTSSGRIDDGSECGSDSTRIHSDSDERRGKESLHTPLHHGKSPPSARSPPQQVGTPSQPIIDEDVAMHETTTQSPAQPIPSQRQRRAGANEERARLALERLTQRRKKGQYDPEKILERPKEEKNQKQNISLEDRLTLEDARKRRRSEGRPTLGDILSGGEEDLDASPIESKRHRMEDSSSSSSDQGIVDGLRKRLADSKQYAAARRAQIIPTYTGPDDQEDDEATTTRNLAEQEQIRLEMQALEAGLDSKHSTSSSSSSSSKIEWPPVLNAEQEQSKAVWKDLYRKTVQQNEAQAFGVAQSQIDLSKLTADQIPAVLLRPISEDASAMYLKSRLHLWMQVVRLVDSQVDEAIQRANYLFYGLQTVPELEERHMALLTSSERIRELMSRNNMLEIRDPAGRELVQELEAVQNNVDTLMICKLSALDLMRGTKAYVSTKIARLASLRSTQQQLQQELATARENWSTFAQLLDKILDRAAEWKLVRIEGQVYHPVNNHQGQWTRCYEQWHNGEILEFVHKAASLRQKDPEIYGMLYDRGTYWKQIVEILKYTYDDRFPEVQPSRYWYAFENGVYNMEDDRFYEYGSLGFKHLPEEVVCCTFFPQKFDNAEYEWHMQHGPDRKDPWYNIPTPHLDKICETQKWSTGERKWWYAGGGRLLFPLGKFDNWGKMWIHLGRAGCGKTTFLKYIAGYFPRFKVGIINNNCEKVFTIQHLEKTWSWFGFDIKENWNLDQTLWNTMIDGGMLPLARKYLSSKLTDFAQNGAIASNRLMNWPDLNGQLLRRLFPHIYRRAPENMGTPMLAFHMESERGAALKKFACGYRAKAAKHKSDQLTDNVLPKSIRESLALIRREANPLMAYLESDKICMNPNYYCDRKRFIREFSSYAVEIGVRGAKSLPSVNDAFFADVLEAKNLRIANDTRILPTGLPYKEGTDHTEGRPEKRQMWIVGCAFRDSEDQQPAYRPEIQAENGFQPISNQSSNPLIRPQQSRSAANRLRWGAPRNFEQPPPR